MKKTRLFIFSFATCPMFMFIFCCNSLVCAYFTGTSLPSVGYNHSSCARFLPMSMFLIVVICDVNAYLLSDSGTELDSA